MKRIFILLNNYLLDTQVALWIINSDPKLDKKDFFAKFDLENSVFIFHQASTWEIQIKYQLGKLPLPLSPKDFLVETIERSGFVYENISDKGIFFLEKLPAIHRDPFDRLLISHAMVNAWTILTRDQTITEYPLASIIV